MRTIDIQVVAPLAIATGVALTTVWATAMASQRRISRAARTQIGLETDADPPTLPRVSRTMTIAAAVIGIGVALLIGPLGVVLGAVPPLVRRVVVSRRRRLRRAALDAALGGILQLLIDQLRVGRDLTGALHAVADRADEPLDGIIDEVLAEARLGVPIHEVLDRIASTEGSRHLDVIASAIGLHAHHGGSLTEILATVAESIDAEDTLRREVETLTADARLSAQVLLGLPVAALVLLSLLSPGYATPLIATPAGRAMAMVGGVLGVIGWWWLRALSRPGEAS